MQVMRCSHPRSGRSISIMNHLSKDSVTFLTIDAQADGQRLDNFLIRHLKGVPKSHIYRIIRSGEVRVNKGRVEALHRLADGDVVRVPPVRLSASSSPATVMNIPVRDFAIVFEDDALIALDKPAGVAVHGGSGVSFGVIEQLRAQRPQAKFLELVHRLDRETSGLLLVAKKRSALTGLHTLMREGGMEKHYAALVVGVWPHARQHLKFPLHKFVRPDGERRVRVDETLGQVAHTIVTLQQVRAGYSLVDAELKTGRTHQIRVHLAHSGFPIAGDDKYGDFTRNKQLEKQGLKRMFLHAAHLTFAHPLTGEILKLAAPLSPALQAFWQHLGDTAEKK